MNHARRPPPVLPGMAQSLGAVLRRMGVLLAALSLLTTALLWDWSRQIKGMETRDIPLSTALQHLIDDVERHQADLRNELLRPPEYQQLPPDDPGARRITEELNELRELAGGLPPAARLALRLNEFSHLSRDSNLWYWWILDMAANRATTIPTDQPGYARVLRMIQALPTLWRMGIAGRSPAPRTTVRRFDQAVERLQRELRRFQYRRETGWEGQHDLGLRDLHAGLATISRFGPFLNADQTDLVVWIEREIDLLVTAATANGKVGAAGNNPALTLLRVRVQPIEARLTARLAAAHESTLQNIHARMRRLLGEGALIGLFIIMALAAFAHTWIRLRRQAHALAQPLGDIAAAMLRFASGEIDIPIGHSNTREHRLLAKCFRSMQVERSGTRKRLQASASRLSAILNNTADAIVTAHLDGRIQMFNPAAQALFGYTEHDILGRDLTTLMPERYRARHTKAMRRYCGSLQPTVLCTRLDLEGLHHDGSEFPIQLVITAASTGTGETLMIGVLQDVTRQKQAQQAMAEARDAAQRANQAKSRLLAHMSHEIRTPLNAVLGYCQLASGALNGMQLADQTPLDHLQRAGASGRHLLALLDRGLGLSRLQSDEARIEWADVDIAACAQDVYTMNDLAARENGVTLRLKLAPDLPPTLRADASMLRQIMLNLVSNAIKFSPRGGRVDFTLSKRQNRCLIRITDTGKGIAAEAMARIFDVFEQEDDSASREIGGAGLGLTIVKGFTQLLGGEVRVSSEPGRGSCFEVLLRSNPQQSPAAPQQPTGPGMGAPLLAGRPVLIVDDNLLNRDILSDFLGDRGMQVQGAASGDEALRLVAAEQFELVLLDLHMPGMDGFQTATRIRALPHCRQLPIFAVSADTYANTRARAAAVGMSEFIAKPVDLEELLHHVVDALAAAPRQEQAQETASAAQIEPQASAAAISSPAMLDAAGGTAHVGGKTSSYRRLLARFVEQHGDDADQLHACAQADDREGVIKIVHALKGFAGTLGAERLQAAARDLQLALMESKQSCTALATEIHALQQLLRDTLDAMQAYVEGNA